MTDKQPQDADWLQLTLEAGQLDTDALEDALLAAGAVAVTLEDAGDAPVLEPGPGETPLWPQTRVTGLFPAHIDVIEVRARLAAALGEGVVDACRLSGLENRDWVRAWMDSFKPMSFGTRLWVCPSSQPAPDPNGVNLILDPGLAFGTGTHPTTALCLNWLDAHLPADARVIDYGCGSGILGIAAALLGARAVWSTDIDPQALTATSINARTNAVEDRVESALPELFDPPSADVVLANILAGPLTVLAPRLAQLVVPGGHLVLAGIIERQADAVTAAYAEWFDFQPTASSEGWVRLWGRRKPALA